MTVLEKLHPSDCGKVDLYPVLVANSEESVYLRVSQCKYGEDHLDLNVTPAMKLAGAGQEQDRGWRERQVGFWLCLI